MGSLRSEQWVKVERKKVFAFFSDPRNLPRIMPRELGARIEELKLVTPPELAGQLEAGPDPKHAAGTGSTITFSFRPIPFLPIRERWVSEITAYKLNEYFQDKQQKGPMRSWQHTHGFHEEARNGAVGTLIRDEVEYEIGFGPLGAIADKLWVNRAMARTFAHRQTVVEEMLGA